jgi:Asp/Glu/hydantoin racemase
MPQTLALLHTSHVLIPMFSELCEQMIPDVAVFHTVDESLIKNTVAAQSLEKVTVRRVLALIQNARDAGADAVLVTCSSIGPAVPVAREVFDFPVLRVDEAMAEEAVRQGARIGVMATLRTTLEPTVALLRETAAAQSRRIDVVPCLCDGAFDAVIAGDNETHDHIVTAALARLIRTVDVVVLAQASMAGVVERIPRDVRTKPVLSSPGLAIGRAREVLFAARQAAL